MLLSSFPGSLPPTVRSRCSRIDLTNPAYDESIEWLTDVHKIDLEVAHRLTTHGFGPYEVLHMNTNDGLKAYQMLCEGLTSLISGNLSVGAFTRQNSVYDIGLTLKVIQSEIHRGLRRSVQVDHDSKIPVLISAELALKFRSTLFSVYFSIGEFLHWPKRSVDEQLFLEFIAEKLSFSPHRGNK